MLLSTHIVSDLEHIADRPMIMKEGRLLWQGKWNAGKEGLEEVYIFIFIVFHIQVSRIRNTYHSNLKNDKMSITNIFMEMKKYDQ